MSDWTWRLLLIGLGGYVLLRLAEKFYLVVLPFFAGLLAAALVFPIVAFLRGRGMSRALATWLTVLGGLLVIGGVGMYVVQQASTQYASLLDQLGTAVQRLPVQTRTLHDWQTELVRQLQLHRTQVAFGVLSGLKYAADIVAGLILAFFIGFFLLYDGDHIWAWIVGLFPEVGRARLHGAGVRAWTRLAGYVRGTFVIAVYHGVVVAVTLLVMGVPLVAPLALLVFIGSFLPIIGAVLFGAIAVLVTFATKGLVFALVLIGVLVIDNQVEAHLFQPFLVGRYVRLHPLAVALSITAGALLSGVVGAILAVPIVAMVYAVAEFLAADGEPEAVQGSTPPARDDQPEIEDELPGPDHYQAAPPG